MTSSLGTIAYVNRMLDYAHDIHSLPESAAVEDEDLDQAKTFGQNWNRPVCDCDLYNYAHAGCPGPAAKRLPRGWKSGDDV